MQDLGKIEMLLEMVEYERRTEGCMEPRAFMYMTIKIQFPVTKASADGEYSGGPVAIQYARRAMLLQR